SVPFDPEDALDAPFRLSLGRDGEMSAGASLDADRWHDIEMVWDPPWDMEMMSEDLRFMLGRI
ncbi:MAG: hypothetical protein QGG58_09540, partial [Chloroflexota bacterium]|nr:hypothetical protein [Chloroflexota bacterium]